MRVLIIATNTYREIAPAPIGTSLVASRLRRDGHEVRLLDLMFARSPAAEAARVTREFAPDLVGFAIRNIDSQSATSFFDPLPVIQSIVDAVRPELPRHAVTLLGGTAFTTFPTQYLRVLGADYGIAGDDLDPVSRVVASFDSGSPDLATPGLVYWADGNRGEVRCNPFEIRGYADTSFDGWDLLNLRPYRRSLSCFWDVAVVTRTGCPFKCIYCDTFHTFGSRWVLRDPRQVAEELVEVRRRHGVRSVFLADAGFNRPLDHAKAVLEAIAQARPGVDLSAIFEPGEVDGEFARLYHRAGGRLMALFAGSLSDAVLEAGRRPFVVADVMAGSEALGRAGVENMLFMGLGGPGETPATVAETFDRIPRIKSVYVLMDHGFRIEPRTALRDIAVVEGVISQDDDCFKATFYHSPATPPEFLKAQIKAHNRILQFNALRGLPWMGRYVRDKAAAWVMP